jgi:hypothetical protein
MVKKDKIFIYYKRIVSMSCISKNTRNFTREIMVLFDLNGYELKL